MSAVLKLQLQFSVLVALTCTPTFSHARWDIKPSLALSESYTTNVHLESSDLKSDEWITELTPSLFLDNKSKLNPIQGYGQVQGLYYAHHRKPNKGLFQGFIRSQTSILKEMLQLGILADRAQTVLQPSREFSYDSVNGSELASVSRFQIGPRFNYAFSKHWLSRGSYHYGLMEYSKPTPSARTQHAIIEMRTPPTDSLMFKIDVLWDETRQSSEGVSDTFEGLVTLGYRISSRLTPYVSWGYEEHEPFQVQESIEGQRWHAGLMYKPSPRFTFDGYYGKRPFGDTYALNIQWDKKHNHLDVSYREDVSNYYLSHLEILQSMNEYSYGLSSFQFQPESRRDMFVRKTWEMNWILHMRKAVFSLTPYYESRQQDKALLASENGRGVNADLQFNMAHQVHAHLLSGFSRQRLINALVDHRWQLGLGLEYQMKKKSFAHIQFTHFEINRNTLRVGENRIQLGAHIKV